MKWLEISPIKKYGLILPLIAVTLVTILGYTAEEFDSLAWIVFGVFLISPILVIISFISSLIENNISKTDKPIIKSFKIAFMGLLIYLIMFSVITFISNKFWVWSS